MSDNRKPDAIQFPPGWDSPALDATYRRAIALQMHFEGILGVHRVFLRERIPLRFVTADPYDTVDFAKGHPLEGFPRYEWVEQPDGLVYGYLVEAARAV